MKSLRISAEPMGFLSTLILILCLAGCRNRAGWPAASEGTVSPVYSTFSPEQEFERLGFTVDADLDGGRVSPGEVYGWKPHQGSLVLPNGTAGCEVVALAIRRELDRAVGAECIDELNLQRPRERGRPVYGMLRYQQQGLRGLVHVWLFPDESETRINYAILLREDKLRGDPHSTVAHF